MGTLLLLAIAMVHLCNDSELPKSLHRGARDRAYPAPEREAMSAAASM